MESDEVIKLGARLWSTLTSYDSYFYYDDFTLPITKQPSAFVEQSHVLPQANNSLQTPSSFSNQSFFNGYSYFGEQNYEQIPESKDANVYWNNGVSPMDITEQQIPQFQQINAQKQEYARNGDVTLSPQVLDPLYGALDDSRAPIPPIYEPLFKNLKLKEKEGFEEAKAFVMGNLDNQPDRIKWRLCLELADFAKRESLMKEARDLYRESTLIHPYASQTWLEYAKLEEECGQLLKCQKILNFGLMYCPFNEALMIKSIKLEERMGNIKNARSILARLKSVPIDKSWRIILEGALMEARQSNIQVARKVFKYLMKYASGYGNVFQEACLLEERCGDYKRAIEIAEKGLEENPRYGPLYLTILRLHEKVANGDLTFTREIVERAMKFIPKELKWKVYYEAAQIEDRAGNLDLARQAYVKSVAHCPQNLLWKVWLAGARTELYSRLPGSHNIARKLIERSLSDVPSKKKAQVWLEWAHLEEFVGDLTEARYLLKQARKESSHEWKVYLETILLEIRANNLPRAIKAAKKSLEKHSGTGRLWALLIFLMKSVGEEEQMEVFKNALQEVPKSGEVWCEGARIHLSKGNFLDARRYLEFAIHFTPQFGDSFIEYLRMELMEHGPHADVSKLEQLCLNAEPNYGTLWMYCKKSPTCSTRQVLKTAQEILQSPVEDCVLALGKFYDASKLNTEERWRLIFGCDELKP